MKRSEPTVLRALGAGLLGVLLACSHDREDESGTTVPTTSGASTPTTSASDMPADDPPTTTEILPETSSMSGAGGTADSGTTDIGAESGVDTTDPTTTTVGGTGSDSDVTSGCTDCPARYRRVFVSTQPYSPKFGELEVADDICQTDGQVLPSIDGSATEFRAWLSVTGKGPGARLDPKDGLGYYRTDGTLVAADWQQILSGSLANPISTDVNKQPLSDLESALIWTGTSAAGEPMEGLTCADWTKDEKVQYAMCGSPTKTDDNWTEQIACGCDNSFRIYCIEVPAQG